MGPLCLEYACHTDNIGDENVHHLLLLWIKTFECLRYDT